MKDLSREERLNQRIKELERQIYEKAYAYGDKKWLRIKRTFFAICGVIYFLEFILVLKIGISDINIDTICGLLFSPLVVAGFVMFISLGVWTYVLDKTVKERIEIAVLEGRLDAIKAEEHNNLEDAKIEELKRHIEYLKNYYANKCDNCMFLKLLQNNTEENKQSNEVEENEED